MNIGLAPIDHAHFFAGRRLNGGLHLAGSRVAVELWVPDLSQAPCRVTAGRGLSYEIKVPLTSEFRLHFACSSSLEEATYRFSPPTVLLASTGPRHVEHPFRLEVIDTARGLKMGVLLKEDGTHGRMVIRALPLSLDTYDLIFREQRWRNAASPPCQVLHAS